MTGLFFAIASIILIIIATNIKGRLERLASPIVLFGFYYWFVYFLVPYIQSVNNVGRFDYFDDGGDGFAIQALSICLLYFTTTVVTAYAMGLRNIDKRTLTKGLTKVDKKSIFVKNISIALLFIGVFLTLYLIIPYLSNLSALMKDRINIFSGSQYSLKMIEFGTPALILMVLLINSGQNKKWWGLILVFTVVVTLGLLLGSRARALFPVIFMIGAYMLSTKKEIGIRFIIKTGAAIIILFMIASTLGHIRGLLLKDDIGSIRNLQSENSALNELYSSFGNAELIAFILENKNRWSPAYGKTYYAGFVAFVPRALWPNKPLGGGPMLANIVAPGVYKLGSQEGNSSLTTGSPLEAYMNGGYSLVIIVAIIHGLLINALTRLGAGMKTPLQLTFYLLSLQFIGMSLVNAEFLGAFTGYLFVAGPLYMMMRITISKSVKNGEINV